MGVLYDKLYRKERVYQYTFPLWSAFIILGLELFIIGRFVAEDDRVSFVDLLLIFTYPTVAVVIGIVSFVCCTPFLQSQGTNDPLDASECGTTQLATGGVTPVKVLGMFPLLIASLQLKHTHEEWKHLTEQHGNQRRESIEDEHKLCCSCNSG